MPTPIQGRFYAQGLASLGFFRGASLTFRLNPDQVDWNFQINTAVTETVGGRVVQVLGANLSDLTIRGSIGDPKGSSALSWQMAEEFFSKSVQLVKQQSDDALMPGKVMQHPMIFNFPAKGWKFEVYIKSLTDETGSMAVTHRPGRFSYKYNLTLSVLNDLSNTSRVIGKTNGVLKRAGDAAIADYIKRLAVDGVGWKPSLYNGPEAILQATTTPDAPVVKKATGVANKQGNTAQ